MARGGVTLLEILICIAILAFGLLGVVSLIPAGHFAVAETSKADRSTACAQAAKDQIHLRGMLDPANWREHNGGVSIDPATGTNRLIGADYTITPPTLIPPSTNGTMVIDPLMLSQHESDPDYAYLETFPVFQGAIADELPRLTLNSSGVRMPVELAERIFYWEDDTIVTINDSDPDLRPRQNFRSWDGGLKSAPLPYRAVEDDTAPSGSCEPLLREGRGDYSWLLTVTPSSSELELPATEKKTFEVSTVVFHKRDFTFDRSAPIPPERMAEVDPSFAGIAGAGASDIPLVAPATLSTEKQLEYLKVKPNQWLMLVGDVQDERFASGERDRVAKWYRVISIDDELTTTPSANTVRWVTVTGPEWRAGSQPGEMQGTKAILVDNVIGVFTETMTLER
jgi:hypothetical protein